MELKEVLGKKDKKVDPDKKEAKLNAIKEMRKMASEMMGDSLKSKLSEPKKAVTVAADSKEDLKEGLKTAGELLDSTPEEDEEMEDPTEEAEEVSSDNEPSLEKIEELQKQIEEMKKALLAKK